LRKAYPEVKLKTNSPILLLDEICRLTDETFMFVFDEWDYIFEAPFATAKDKRDYITFLRNLIKDRAYVSMAYMTGILPIAKYSSGSDLNMFSEYNFASWKFSPYFGFNDEEVDDLFERYKQQSMNFKMNVTREGLRLWYNGYSTQSGMKMYNPYAVVNALVGNQLGSYWANSGPRDEILTFIEKNVSDIRAAIAIMVSGEPVTIEFAEKSVSIITDLQTKDEMLSTMALYGLLSIDESSGNETAVRIPNKEVMGKFTALLAKESSLGYIHSLAKQSKAMLNATLASDADEVCRILEERHDIESPIFTYNNENELAAVVNLAYLSSRDRYDMVRENKGGKGYVDFLFFPFSRGDDCIILELKVNDTPENAIAQIKKRKYQLAFQGTAQPYTGRLLLVVISYSKKTKKHDCVIEIIWPA
jgi:hypothetical protein